MTKDVTGRNRNNLQKILYEAEYQAMTDEPIPQWDSDDMLSQKLYLKK